MSTQNKGHICSSIETISCDLFHQMGVDKGARVLLVGESPAANGWHDNKACRTNGGKMLATGRRIDELLKPLGLTADTCGFTELSKCCVSDRKDLPACSKKCWPLFLELLKGKQYRLIVLLGVHTTKLAAELMEQDMEMGKMKQITIGGRPYAVLPIYHPSPINPRGRERNRDIMARERNTIEALIA
ncbi:hypothetical protein A2333_01790 [Candidatus Wolfebacteria bacterium RIFOXYB2_FULL_49_7]|uniref:Uracil-DNA glycosylase-like domain-containing protein n=1 Tax=Candidatus Wolfebacteria bacterium RIFOXYB1_FULL_54_12 TaxID=1802559 RepID=A0A1F8DVP2_9BACT|nr:MAG: hypothetical protein A2372_00370 [Candidatus Wolfebacteria bacterium RIFOXYB1_FULL_54_12]OGM94795.1 MAG: hypothetical protein A2333_01790 [Candidatus Wolfebacteria bacterium RIFOXYB2_FULL_49_7]